MWCVCMFDLPVQTKIQVRNANRFRRQLKQFGFSMKQFSVYVKYIPDLHSTTQEFKRIKANLPVEGDVSMLKVTEKQMSSMLSYYNSIKQDHEPPPLQLTLFDDF